MLPCLEASSGDSKHFIKTLRVDLDMFFKGLQLPSPTDTFIVISLS